MKHLITKRPADAQRSTMTLVGVYAGRRLSPSGTALNGALGGQLKKAMNGSAFEGKPGQTLTIHAPQGGPATRVMLVGVGKRNALSGAQFLKALRAAMGATAANRANNVVSYLGEIALTDRDAAWQLREAVIAASQAVYQYDETKSTSLPVPSLRQARYALPPDLPLATAQAALHEGEAVGAGMTLAKDLGNLPGNLCTPTYLGERARELDTEFAAIKTKVLSAGDMKRLGMGSLLSVAAGSNEPPKLIVMEYKGGPRSQAPTALVGKGVTFDTGGISLKPGGAMDEMKFDMCGAASVFGSMLACAKMALPLNVVGLVPATENMPSGTATKPGDIVTSMDGQTIEILNTDAEGRLILCDALTYAKQFEPDAMVDIATLTGACVVALGGPATGLFSNDQDLANDLLAAGESTGDRAWQMPIWDEYDDMLKSNFADMANIGGREAGAVTAACFLARFTKDRRWAHLDIAGSAWLKGKAKGSTGRPVRLLMEYLGTRARAELAAQDQQPGE